MFVYRICMSLHDFIDCGLDMGLHLVEPLGGDGQVGSTIAAVCVCVQWGSEQWCVFVLVCVRACMPYPALTASIAADTSMLYRRNS